VDYADLSGFFGDQPMVLSVISAKSMFYSETCKDSKLMGQDHHDEHPAAGQAGM
jgi:hypothetical protein